MVALVYRGHHRQTAAKKRFIQAFWKSESLFLWIKRGQAASQPSESPSPYMVSGFPETPILFEDMGYGFGRTGIAVLVLSAGQPRHWESGEMQAVCRGEQDIWKYCTKEQWKEMICSFGLLGDPEIPQEIQMAVLYRFSRHSSCYYREKKIPKRFGGSPLPVILDSGLKAGSEENSETYFIGTPRIILRLRLQKRRGNPGQRCGSCGAGERFEAGY